MRKLLMLILILSTIFTITACGKSSKGIVGNWERNDDSVYNGMRVSVEKLDGGKYRGTITEVAATSFKNGDVKWRDVTDTKDQGFDLSDLGTGGWYEMSATLSVDGDTLQLRNLVDTGEVGSNQIWKRIK